MTASGLDAPPIPTHFEVRFGPPRRQNDQENELEDPLSTDDPFELQIDEETIKIVGRIDRVDLAQVGERKVFSIFDYKSGRPVLIKGEQVEAGVTLQLLLYAMAAEKLLVEHGAVPWQVGYWAVQQKSVLGGKQSLSLYQAAGGELTPTDEWQDLYPKLRARVGRMIEWIRAGAFPMHSYHDDCTSRCDFKTVCRVSQVRSLEKAWPPPEETP
jgi:RecB family exonuclease